MRLAMAKGRGGAGEGAGERMREGRSEALSVGVTGERKRQE